MKTTYLIVPALTDVAGQCRIVSRSHEQVHPNPLVHYRQYPQQWTQAGIMNSQGKLVCLDAPAVVVQEFKDCEPLAAGQTFSFDAVQQESHAEATTEKWGVLVHPEMGVYLGCCMGLGFWSNLDPAGQNAAVCFKDEKVAREYMATWDSGAPSGVTFMPVTPDEFDGSAHYATVQACVQAGLPGWDPNAVESREVSVSSERS